jgi:hypothetical protein
MVQPAENTSHSYPAIGWQLMTMDAWARPRSTTRIRDAGSQARMWSSPIVVGNPLPQDLPKMHLAQQDHVIQAFTADRSKCPQVIVNFCRKGRIPIMNQESVGVIARGMASRNCCKVQAAVGWAVTFLCAYGLLAEHSSAGC